jgi:hypothetical protein
MAKSSRRRKQDRARTESRHAEEARRRARRQADELFERATDTALPPAELAVLIMGELADSTGTVRIAQTRLEKGARPATLAETARLLLAACTGAGLAGSPSPGSIPPGVLAFVAVAAHANGDEEEEARCTQALLDLARAVGDEELLKVAGDVLSWTDPRQAADMLSRYLLRHPHDLEAFTIWGQAEGRAEESAVREELGAANLGALIADPGDPSDPGYALRLIENGRRVWEADPRAKARFQARTAFSAEIMRRRGMPLWEAERLWRAEADE